MQAFLGGVADVELYKGNSLFALAKTMIDTSVAFSITLEDVRAGRGAKLWGKYAHSSTMNVTLTDVMFKLDFIASNVGGNISIGGDVTEAEEVTLGAGGTFSVKKTPALFNNSLIGWYSKPGENNWTTFTFNSQSGTVPGGQEGDIYCVRYFNTNEAARTLVVSANFIPDTVHARLTAPLFAGDYNNVSDATQIGEVIFDIPRLMLSGEQEIAMSMTGVANTPLTGAALATSTSNSCESDSIYGEIIEVIYGSNWEDDAIALAIDNADIELATNGTTTLQVYALFNNALPKLVNNSDLTFTSTTEATATVDATGKVTAVAAGTTIINVVLTKKNSIEAFANVTVS